MAAITLEYATDMIVNHSRYKGSEKWKKRVDKMPSWQVMAVYYRMLHSGEFNKKIEEPVEKPSYTQPTLFDFGMEVPDDKALL